MKFTKKAYTRITLALDVLGRLSTGPHAGYHELAVVKHQIDLYDEIAVEESSVRQIACDDPRVPTDSANICWRAVDLVKELFGIDADVNIAIRKRIPLMGGLAGGSANAAATLSLLNTLWNLELDTARLEGLGRQLGMDVPYYFTGKTVLDSESTGVLRAVPTPLHFVFILVVPTFGVSTARAYAGLDYSRIGSRYSCTEEMLRALETGDRNRVVRSMHNDFEPTVFDAYPELASLRDEMMHHGAQMAVLSGSGSTMVGVARDVEHAHRLKSELQGFEQVDRVLVSSSIDEIHDA